MSNQAFKIGSKAKISQGSGIDSGKIVTIVDRSAIKTDGRNIPTNVQGAYKPVDWSREVAIQYADGKFGTMFKNRMTPVSGLSEKVRTIHEFAKKCMMNEKLILKRKDDKIYTVSDDPDEKKKSFKDWETVRNKEKLKKAGFSFDGVAWWLPTSKLKQAQEIIAQINNSPIEKLLDKVEDLPEFIDATDDFTKKGELTRKIEGFIDTLSGEVDAVKASEAFKSYVEFSTKFHSYSFNNIMLIYLQNKNATRLAGIKKWNELHRRVKPGAKAIWILAPVIVKDDDYQAGDDSKVDDAVKSKRVIGFRAVRVFDVADTEAIDERGNIPEKPQWHGNDEPEEKADKLVELGIKLADELGVKVDREAARRGEKGWAKGDHINVVTGIAGAGAFGTLVHEIAHSLMHFKETSPFYVNDEKRLSSAEMELEAETISYVVLKHYGLPAQHHPVYLASWKANKDSFQKHMAIMTKVSSFIIKNLDRLASKTNEPAPAPTA
jgi:hypothetical protein